VRPYFGNSEQLAGTKWLEHGGDVELVGSGTVATPPAWAALLQACAMDETVEVATRVDYTPVTDLQASVTNYVYKSGVLHKALGARGKLTIGMKQGEIPKLAFAFLGLYGGVSAAVPSGIDFSAFEVPQVVNNTNSTKLYIGGTVAESIADFFAVSAILASFSESASETWAEPGAKTTWFGFTAAWAAAAAGVAVIGEPAVGVESGAVGAVGVALPRIVPSTIPAMATTTSNATAAMANLRDEFRVGGVCRASMSVPSSAATDSSWR
jgi:hypothetical protein